jgi:hypothetical protein
MTKAGLESPLDAPNVAGPLRAGRSAAPGGPGTGLVHRQHRCDAQHHDVADRGAEERPLHHPAGQRLLREAPDTRASVTTTATAIPTLATTHQYRTRPKRVPRPRITPVRIEPRPRPIVTQGDASTRR